MKSWTRDSGLYISTLVCECPRWITLGMRSSDLFREENQSRECGLATKLTHSVLLDIHFPIMLPSKKRIANQLSTKPKCLAARMVKFEFEIHPTPLLDTSCNYITECHCSMLLVTQLAWHWHSWTRRVSSVGLYLSSPSLPSAPRCYDT